MSPPSKVNPFENWQEHRWLWRPQYVANKVLGLNVEVPEAQGYGTLVVDFETFKRLETVPIMEQQKDGTKKKVGERKQWNPNPQYRDKADNPVRVRDMIRLLEATAQYDNSNRVARMAANTVLQRGIVRVFTGLHSMDRATAGRAGGTVQCLQSRNVETANVTTVPCPLRPHGCTPPTGMRFTVVTRKPKKKKIGDRTLTFGQVVHGMDSMEGRG